MTITQPLSTLIFTVSAGILSLVLGKKLKLPSILFLLVFGVLLGPGFANYVNPIIFRHNFSHYISLMVALILFEGAASLKIRQFKEISSAVQNLLTIGVLCTLIMVPILAHFVAKMSWTKSILFGAIMIVTGPAVVIPILKRISVREKLHNALKWEGILIDPLGVITAVVLFEFFVSGHATILQTVVAFFGRLCLGGVLGLVGGFMMYVGLTHKWLLRFEGEELGGLFLLATNILFYGISEWILPESGLVTVTVAGLFIGNKKFPFKDDIFHFKEQVTQFALAVLFVLIASNIPILSIKNIVFEGSMLLILMIILVRPASVFLSLGFDKSFSFKEKLFMGLFAPRGIVSAVLASLFAIQFEEKGLTGQGVFLPLAFHVIIGTIIFYSVTAGIIAKILGVKENKKNGVVIVGASALGRLYASELVKRGIKVAFIDNNYFKTFETKDKTEVPIYHGSAFDKDFIDSLDLKGMGYMIALTTNHEVNVLSCQLFSKFLTRKNVFRLWDKSDGWDTVVAPHFDASMGNPMVYSSRRPGLDIWELIEIGSYSVRTKKLNQGFRVKMENLEIENISFPLFAIKNGDPIFLYPNREIPKESEIIYLDANESVKNQELIGNDTNTSL